MFLVTLWSSIKQIKAPKVFAWEHTIALQATQGNRVISRRGRSLMVFLDLRQTSAVYSRVTAGMILQSSCLFNDVRTPVSLRGSPHESPRGLAGQYGRFSGEAGDPGSLSSCHSDIGIPINFQQESVIVTLLSIELRMPLKLSKGCKASCPEEVGT